MALTLSIKVSERASCSAFIVYDKTGPYNSITNATGYGGSNLDLSDLIGAYFLVTLPGSSTPVQVDISLPSLTIPEITGDIGHYVTAEDLGLGEDASLPDGYYEIVYALNFTDASSSTGETLVTTTKQCYFFCQVKCCVSKLVARTNILTCCTQPQDMLTLLQAYVSMVGLKEAVKCSQINKADRILAQLQKLCLTSNCNC